MDDAFFIIQLTGKPAGGNISLIMELRESLETFSNFSREYYTRIAELHRNISEQLRVETEAKEVLTQSLNDIALTHDVAKFWIEQHREELKSELDQAEETQSPLEGLMKIQRKMDIDYLLFIFYEGEQEFEDSYERIGKAIGYQIKHIEKRIRTLDALNKMICGLNFSIIKQFIKE